MVNIFLYQVEYDFDQRMMELKEEEEKQKEYRKNLKRKRKPEPEPEEMVKLQWNNNLHHKKFFSPQVGDPDMMAMMGFSGFGTSSKKTWWSHQGQKFIDVKDKL